jgi:DNA-binding transcriptional LysR family regulator
MSLSHYEIFIKAAELGSLTRTAEVLGYTQSGVSHMIGTLEQELQLTLLIRSKSGVRLSSDGEKLIPYMREVVNQDERLHQVAASIRGLQTGSICIGTFSSVATHWLPDLLQSFAALYPAIEVQLLDGVYEDVEYWLAEGRADCGFVTLPGRRNFDSWPLRQDRMLAVLPLKHPLCSRQTLPLSLLAEEPFILPGEGAHYDIGRLFSQAGCRPRVRFSFRDDHTALAMVEKGMGITILPELVLQDCGHKVHLMELSGAPSRTIGIAVPNIRQLSSAAEHFLQHVLRWTRKNPPVPPVPLQQNTAL